MNQKRFVAEAEFQGKRKNSRKRNDALRTAGPSELGQVASGSVTHYLSWKTEKYNLW